MSLILAKPAGQKLTLAKSFTWNETVWNPSMIQTALWLDANDSTTITQSGGAITSWRDKSGNNSTATADGNPTYNATGLSTNKPAVQLDGAGDAFVSSITGIGSFSALDIYMVTQTAAAAAADTNSGFFWGYGNGGIAGGIYPANTGLSMASSTGVLTGEKIMFVNDATTFTSGRLGSSTYVRAANTAQILNSKTSTSGISLLLDGATVTLDLTNEITTSTTAAPAAKSYSVDNNLYFGGSRNNGSIFYGPAIKFAEVIVSSTLLSTLYRQKLEGYLAWKWGLTANLPAGHPYKTVGPTP